MKKFLLTIVCMAFCLLKTQAQNDTIITVSELQQTCATGPLNVCTNQYSRVVVYSDCNDVHWSIYGASYTNNPMIFDSQVNHVFAGGYNGCGIGFNYGIVFKDPNVPTETTDELWKRQNEPITLEAPAGSYSYQWNIGMAASTIEVVTPGTYTCGVSDLCATSIQTFIVRDNVEIYRATVDLETNLNKATWQFTPEQAEYINEVKVYRDGMLVGTVPYEQGYFLDAIGSDNAARNYRIVGITPEGTECPIPSYQKGTLHVDYSANASNPNKLNMAWTPPFIEEGAAVSVNYFQICKYDPATGEVTVIDQLGANNTIASYNRDLFEGGYAVIGVIFNDGKADEEVSFSNRSEDIITAVDEQSDRDFRIYPNPAKDRVIIEGTGTLAVTNTVGQIILTREIDGKETIELPQGMYFVKMNGVTRKIVVE